MTHSRLFAVVALTLSLAFIVGCGRAEEAKRKKEESQKHFMEEEAKARAAAEAKEASEKLASSTEGCNGGKAEACVDLGRLHLEGKGVPKDAGKALEAFAKACTAKSKDGCRMAANTETDGKRKLGVLTTLCDLGDADGCLTGAALADELVKAGQLPEPKKPADRPAMQLLKKACGLGGALACTARGVGLINDDPAGAVESMTKGCDLGEPTSCHQLALLYKEGKGVKKKDDKKAEQLMKKACAKGLKEACAG